MGPAELKTPNTSNYARLLLHRSPLTLFLPSCTCKGSTQSWAMSCRVARKEELSRR